MRSCCGFLVSIVCVTGLSACGGSATTMGSGEANLVKPTELPGTTDIKQLTKNAKPARSGMMGMPPLPAPK
jgi:hypothetical protein